MKKEKLKDQLGSGFSRFRFLQVGGYIQGSGISRKGDIYKVQSSPGKGDTYKVQGSPGKEIQGVPRNMTVARRNESHSFKNYTCESSLTTEYH